MANKLVNVLSSKFSAGSYAAQAGVSAVTLAFSGFSGAPGGNIIVNVAPALTGNLATLDADMARLAAACSAANIVVNGTPIQATAVADQLIITASQPDSVVASALTMSLYNGGTLMSPTSEWTIRDGMNPYVKAVVQTSASNLAFVAAGALIGRMI